MSRNIFEFRIRGRTVTADPIGAYYALAEGTKGQLAQLLRHRMDGRDFVVESALERLLPAVQEAFGLGSGIANADAIETLLAFMTWLAERECEGREWADMVAEYGPVVLTVPYVDYVRLWLNLPRLQARRTMAVAEGLGLYHGGGNVPASFCDAVAATPAEGREMEATVNLSRLEQRIMERHRSVRSLETTSRLS